MILVDASLLLYAYDSESRFHVQARDWWEQALNGEAPVWLCWPTVLAFIRISTNPRIVNNPFSLDEAFEIVDAWTEREVVTWLQPGSQHWEILKQTLRDGQAAGPLVTDGHIATLALERGAVVYSADRDFARFPGLRWVNPLEPERSTA